MKIIEDKQNPLLKRREVKVVVEAGKNPSIQESAKMIVEHFKVEEDCVVVRLVKGKFGRNTFLIVANIYNSKEDKLSIEPKQKKKKQAGQREEKEEQKKAEEKKEEKSAEQKPEKEKQSGEKSREK